MCNCKQRIMDEFSERFQRYGENAGVRVDCYISVRVWPFTLRKRNGYFDEEKELLPYKRGLHYGVDMRFCPICGEKFDKPRGSW